MIQYMLRRVMLTLPTIVVISVISFTLIQLPPGDWLTTHIARLAETGERLAEEEIQALYRQYGLDKPMYYQYFKWAWNSLHGDFGWSFEYNRSVGILIWERLGLTVVISTCTLMFIWIVAFPIAFYSATHQYSILDHVFSFVGFIGLGMPDFLIALILLWIGLHYFQADLTGLFSDKYLEASWSLGKVVDMFKHMWMPLIILGTSGTAGLIRTTRANLLDQIRMPYVTTARAKGLTELRLLFKYPVRVALRPFVSTVGWTLPGLVSGSTIVAVVMGLPTAGPLLLQALMTQDMYLAGTFVMMLSILTVIGTLISDILLIFVDPRVRFES
jgi:peptide/nickel transport system permease protein